MKIIKQKKPSRYDEQTNTYPCEREKKQQKKCAKKKLNCLLFYRKPKKNNRFLKETNNKNANCAYYCLRNTDRRTHYKMTYLTACIYSQEETTKRKNMEIPFHFLTINSSAIQLKRDKPAVYS